VSGPPPAAAPPESDAARLARKYAALVELRRRRDDGGDAAGGGALRALAAEFPGCLRELDTLGLPELERRAQVCADARNEPWMSWIAGYHALMRAAFAVRAAPGIEDRAELARLASVGAGLPLAEDFVAAVLAPPGGRVGVVVLRALAARFDVPAPEIAAKLFPIRRPSPYIL
jgi:hypothetical protein